MSNRIVQGLWLGVATSILVVLAALLVHSDGATSPGAARSGGSGDGPSATAARRPCSLPAAQDDASRAAASVGLHRQDALARLRARDPRVEVYLDPEGHLSLLAGDLSGGSGDGPVEEARSFLRAYGALWGLVDPERDLALDEARSVLSRDELGTTHVSFAQVVSGVPVLGRGAHVHLRSDGGVYLVTASIDADAVRASVPTHARVPSREACPTVAQSLGIPLEPSSDAALGVWRGPLGLRLVWEVRAHSLQPVIVVRCLLDAGTGEILDVRDTMACNQDSWRDKSVLADDPLRRGQGIKAMGVHDNLNYLLVDQAQLPHIYTYWAMMPGGRGMTLCEGKLDGEFYAHFLGERIEKGTLAPIAWSHTQRFDPAYAPDVAIHANMRKVVRYWSNRFGRKSWNKDSDAKPGLIRIGTHVVDRARILPDPLPPGYRTVYDDFHNAAYVEKGVFALGAADPSDRMLAPVALDIVAHEFGHAVLCETFDHIGLGVRPAFHEHFGDAFGVFTERRMDRQAAAGTRRKLWTIGEDSKSDGTCIRDMEHPRRVRRDQFDDSYRADPHENGEIFNRWLYLWIEGSPTNPNSSGSGVTGLIQRYRDLDPRHRNEPAVEKGFHLAEAAYYRLCTTYLDDRTTVTMENLYALLKLAIRDASTDASGQLDPVPLRAATEAFRAIGLAP